MAVYIVRFDHPNEVGWHEWVLPHVDWVRHQVERGSIIASGPSVGTPIRQGWLIMSAPDEDTLRAVIATDPFWEHGVIEGLQITGWNPLFGALVEHSSTPGGFDASALRSTKD